MTHLPPDDERRWQEFLRNHRPTPPPESANVEEQLMNAVAKSTQEGVNQPLWVWPPALVAGLLMLLSSYRLLTPLPEPSHSASLEAFMQDNWNQVMGETSPSSSSTSVEVDWRVEAYAAH